MNQSGGPPAFVVGLALVVFASYFASWTIDTGVSPSPVPTVVFCIGSVLVLWGQLWFLGAFLEQPELSPAALVMVVLFGLTPGFVALSQTRGTAYRIITWVSAGDLVLVGLFLSLPVVVAVVGAVAPKSWIEARQAKARAKADELNRKPKLPG